MQIYIKNMKAKFFYSFFLKRPLYSFKKQNKNTDQKSESFLKIQDYDRIFGTIF